MYATAPPLDYSFKELKSCAELESEEPRFGGRRRAQAGDKDANAPHQDDTDPVGSDATGGPAATPREPLAGSGVPALPQIGGAGPVAKGTVVSRLASHAKRIVRDVTVAVKLNNNSIGSLQDLPQALRNSPWIDMEDPLRNCQWIDISFNNLRIIEPELLQFHQLKALYLHGNSIKSLPSVERLSKLTKLISLTLNGNPVECSRCYRMYTVGALTKLRSLDHSTVTEEESREANAWFKAHQKRLKVRKDKLEEAYLNSLNE